MSRHSERKNRRNRYSRAEEINPMDHVSNLADVMLILAVGIMLALVLHWNVDIETRNSETVEETTQNKEAISFNDSDLENNEELPDSAERMGNVYYDPDTGTYYIIKDSDAE